MVFRNKCPFSYIHFQAQVWRQRVISRKSPELFWIFKYKLELIMRNWWRRIFVALSPPVASIWSHVNELFLTSVPNTRWSPHFACSRKYAHIESSSPTGHDSWPYTGSGWLGWTTKRVRSNATGEVTRKLGFEFQFWYIVLNRKLVPQLFSDVSIARTGIFSIEFTLPNC